MLDYNNLFNVERYRTTRVSGRNIEEEVDADRGRVLFSPAFRRLQNKAQVFSLERNAAVRSRLTHSIEVSSVGRFVAQQAIKSFTAQEKKQFGITGKERAILSVVETACLLHDIGNPPFGHFGESAISDWFHVHGPDLVPRAIGGGALKTWNNFYDDFRHFDGNPQGFRTVTKLQAKETGDLSGMNLTATTLAAIIKYPWTTDSIGDEKYKAGYYRTESIIAGWVRSTLRLEEGQRHPLVYLMEAADDIAYCLSDIEDGIEKGLTSSVEFAVHMQLHMQEMKDDDVEIAAMKDALDHILNSESPAFRNIRFSAMEDFRSSFIRFLVKHAARGFRKLHENENLSDGNSLLSNGSAKNLLEAVKNFAEQKLYKSQIVRDRELTAHAVLSGLFNAYKPLMVCDRERFDFAVKGNGEDEVGRKITGEQSLISRLPRKHMGVYYKELDLSDKSKLTNGHKVVAERVNRIRMIIDFISGMTDEYALQTYRLVSGIQINPY
ncbi:dGTPase [Desulfovibrio oxyclinae]|uniref:dGTPase n=1 Tax=Desulfovibrio oxyclinae TaxID=63560 RepID=UPI0003A40543|nr:dGTPase [Desulfovibrio oxyclinae]